jgi:hypothetical protein
MPVAHRLTAHALELRDTPPGKPATVAHDDDVQLLTCELREVKMREALHLDISRFPCITQATVIADALAHLRCLPASNRVPDVHHYVRGPIGHR